MTEGIGILHYFDSLSPDNHGAPINQYYKNINKNSALYLIFLDILITLTKLFITDSSGTP